MMLMRRLPATLLCASLALTVPMTVARAHHSFAMFDKSQAVTLVGTVRSFQWTNPHSYIVVVVAGAGGGESVDWLVETGAPGSLTRLDPRWSADVLKPGDKVTVIINPLRSGEKGGALVDLTTSSGIVLGQHPPH
jgi:hypothetical protein